MIKFETETDTFGKIVRFSVKGHSMYAEEGKDIVCAAVSSAVWMAINGIEKQKLAEVSVKQDNGFVDCLISEKRAAGADAVLTSLLLFMKEMAAAYKKNVFLVQK